MSTCTALVEQLFISVNIINVSTLLILFYMLFLMRDVKGQWLWYLMLVILMVVATFGSDVYSGCELSGVFWRLEPLPVHVGIDWQTYVLLGKFVWQFIYDVMVYQR